MKDSASILEYIENLYHLWCEKPEIHTLNPETLEAVFLELERLREFVLSEENETKERADGYFKFLQNEYPEIGSRTISTRNLRLRPVNKDGFLEMVKAWKKFMESSYRRDVEGDRTRGPL